MHAVALLGLAVMTVPMTALAQSSAPSDDVDPVLAPHRGEIDFCFERQRSIDPSGSGTVVVRATVDATGRVTASELVSSTWVGTDVAARCLVAATARWTFPAGAAGIRELSFVLPPALPVRIAPSPEHVNVTLRVTGPRNDRGLLTSLAAGDLVADALVAAVEEHRSELEACVTNEEESSRLAGALEVAVRVPSGGDLRSDDVTLAGETAIDGAAHILTCFRHVLETVELREARALRRYVLAVEWDFDD